MLDPIAVFTRQFTPRDGGHLYYPSRRSGGKFVTAAEFEQLVEEWERIVDGRGRWKMVGAACAAVLIIVFLSDFFDWPRWIDRMMVFPIVLGIAGRTFWASRAPARLVRSRPAISPPKPASEARREARAMFSWSSVTGMWVFTGAVFASWIFSREESQWRYAWTIGSGLIFLACTWIAIVKWRDRTSIRGD